MTITTLFLLSIGVHTMSVIQGEIIKVAVYEHVVVSPENATQPFTRDEAYRVMLGNLNVFQAKAARAAKQGAKLIVFPEYGVTGFDHNRDSLVPFLEDIPDVSENWTPCDDPDRFNNTYVLRHLSCTAKDMGIYVAANVGDIKPCGSDEDEYCPEDGRYQFNTNVVFSDNGTLVARYHKWNLYDESDIFDPAPEIEYAVFDTPFGRFGTVICFDLLHYYPTQDLIERYGLKNLLVTSAWNVFYPFVFPIQMYAGLSKRNGVNVIAANIRHKDYMMASSGIFGAGAGVEVSSDTDFTNTEGYLLIAEIDTAGEILDESTYQITENGATKGHMESTGEISKDQITNDNQTTGQSDTIESYKNAPIEAYQGIYPHFGMNMSFVVLSELEGSVSMCGDAGICCSLEYKFSVKNDLAILSAVDFEIEYPGEIHMQYCAVHFCPTDDLETCGEPAFDASSILTSIKLQASLSASDYVTFPFVTSQRFKNHTYYSERENYNFDHTHNILQGGPFKYELFNAVVFASVSKQSDRAILTLASAPVSTSTSVILSTGLMFCSVFYHLI